MLGIFMAHTSIWLADDLGMFAILISRLGCSGATMFFILSGFLLTYRRVSIQQMKRTQVIKAAWQKVNKMYVLYCLTFLVAFFARTQWQMTAREWIRNLTAALFHLTMTQDFIPVQGILDAFNGPAWFLSALFGIWIIIYLFPKGINKLMTSSVRQCGAVIATLFLAQEVWSLFCAKYVSNMFHPSFLVYEWLIYFNPIICFSEYCVGVLLGRFCAQKQYSVATQNVVAITTLTIVIGYAMLLMTSVLQVSISKMVIAELFSCLGIMAVISTKTIGYKILSMRPLVWFGDISGYFFLIHATTNYALFATIAEYVPKPWLFFVSLMISLLLSAVADYCYRFKKSKQIIHL